MPVIDVNGQCILKDEEELIRILDEALNITLEKLNEFFIGAVNPDNLVAKANEKLSNYRCHSHVIGIELAVRRWIESVEKEGKKIVITL